MENYFHAQFYKTEPKVSVADLARLTLQVDELVEKYTSQFKNAQNRYYTSLREVKYVESSQNGLNLELKKKFAGQEFPQAIKYETILRK